MKIICEKTGVEIIIGKTNGGKGRVDSIRVYDSEKKLQVVTNIYLGGNEVTTRKLEQLTSL